MSGLIHYQLVDGVAFIGLCRPPINTIGRFMRAAIFSACEQAALDPKAQAIIIHGVSGVFSTGADIAEFGTNAALAEPTLPDTLMRISEINKPVIAAIGKFALGGGFELALACGYRIGEPGTRVGFPEINFDLMPGAGGTQRLPRLIGAESALNLILSGKQVDAECARLLGILDRVAGETEHLLEEAQSYARELIASSAPARPRLHYPSPAMDLPDDFFTAFRTLHQPLWKSRKAPSLVLEALEVASRCSLKEGLEYELALFKKTEASEQSAFFSPVHVL